MVSEKLQNIYDFCESQHISVRQIYDFTLFTNPLGPSQKAKHAMMKALKVMNRSPDSKTRYLRRHISKTEGVLIDSIVFGRGSLGILDIFLASGNFNNVLISAIDAERYRDLFIRHQCECSLLPLSLDGSSSQWDDILAGDNRNIQLVILSNPDPVSGLSMSNEIISQLANFLKETDTILVLDERFIDFTASTSHAALAEKLDNLIVLRTFSFFHCLAGDSLGYAIGSQSFIKTMSHIINPGPVSVTAAAGALASLKDKGFARRTNELLDQEKTYLLDRFSRIKGISVICKQSNYLIIIFDKPVDNLENRLLERRILTESLHHTDNATFLRVPIRRRPDNARFAKTLQRLIVSQ
jgi:histidinol-phosphate/aromatic aminotransferase/cobyric acid decarboxylase-like protein